MNISVTATRQGITQAQNAALDVVFDRLRSRWPDVPSSITLHHGDCVGGDHTAWAKARGRGWRTCAHPPTETRRWRAWTVNDVYEPAAPYLVRNRLIVDHGEVLIGLPHTPAPVPGSGTWSTIEHGTGGGGGLIVVIVILPDGTIDHVTR